MAKKKPAKKKKAAKPASQGRSPDNRRAGVARKPQLAPATLFDYLTLTQIRLIEMQTRLDLNEQRAPTQSRITVNVGVEQSSDGRILANATVDIKGVAEDGGDAAESGLTIHAVYQTAYTVESAQPSEVLELSNHISQHAMLVMWPHIRELVLSTTLRMGLPPLVLPVFTTSDIGKNGMQLRRLE